MTKILKIIVVDSWGVGGRGAHNGANKGVQINV